MEYKPLFLEEFTPCFLYGGYTKVDSSFWHDENVKIAMSKIYYVVKGEVIIDYGDNKIRLKAGEMALIPSFLNHDFYTESGAEKFWFHFLIKSNGKDVTPQFEFAKKITVPEKDADKIKKLFSEAIIKEKNSGFSDKLRSAGAIANILAYYIDIGGINKKEITENEIERAIRVINEDTRGDATLSQLASAANLNVNYFIRKFRLATGFSPMKYAVKVRLKTVKNKLERTNAPVSEIMEQSGFYDAAYFSRLFKKETGFSPREYRNLYKK